MRIWEKIGLAKLTVVVSSASMPPITLPHEFFLWQCSALKYNAALVMTRALIVVPQRITSF